MSWNRLEEFIDCTCRLWTSGTRLWSAWWRTSARPSSTPRSCWTSSSSARTRSRLVSRSASTPRCRAGSRRSCSTRRRSSEVSACCRWVTCWSRSRISAGPNRPTSALRISGPAWVTRRISWSQICTGNLPTYITCIITDDTVTDWKSNLLLIFCALTLLFGWHEGYPACKKWGDGGGGHWLVRREWHQAGSSVCLPLLIFPWTIKSRSSLLAPVDPGGSRKKGRKTVVVWWW